jgi:hypothetical protein
MFFRFSEQIVQPIRAPTLIGDGRATGFDAVSTNRSEFFSSHPAAFLQYLQLLQYRPTRIVQPAGLVLPTRVPQGSNGYESSEF